MRRALVVLAMVAASCGSSDDPRPVPAPVADGNVAELQTSMTELLERLDVMNARLEKLEHAQESGGQALPSVRTGEAPVRSGEAPVLQSAALAERYRHAIILYTRSRHAEARAAFQQIFDADRTSDLADNALFWIGETYYASKEYTTAARYYRRVVDEFGDQNKAPDAHFKLALTFEKSGDLILARKTLEEVISRYPYSTPARAAKSELNRIKY
jgi:tol-pal system protein YbgF